MSILQRTAWKKDFSICDDEKIKGFARSIDDNNPLHHDHEAAVKAGLLGIIAPGIMVTGFVSSAIAEEIPGVMVRRLEIEFLNPLYAGSLPSVFCTVLNQKKRVVKMMVTIKNGFEVVAGGSCLLILPQEFV